MLYIPPSVSVSSLIPSLPEALSIPADPPVYPALMIYPAVPDLIEDVQSGLANPAEQDAEVPTRLDVTYPLFDLCESNHFQVNDEH
jgi:hypothetical protein